MNNLFEKNAGLFLIIFTVLVVFTMTLHPAGGSVEHIIRVTNMIMITHAIAIFSLPFGWIGFWGLTRRIGAEHAGSVLAFAMSSLGLTAIMLAAATNGLVLPIFLHHYKDAAADILSSLKPVLRYSSAVNHAFDYIYTGAFCVAILCWSITMLLTKRMAAWIGWLGVAVSLSITTAVFTSGIAVNSLLGLRLFTIGMVAWILLVGIVLYRQNTIGGTGNYKPKG